jgi:hypothetical protein
MIKLVYSALALTLVSVPGIASENEWSSLDQEIANLSSSLSAQNTSGPKVGGWVISSIRMSDDVDTGEVDDDGDPKDQLGFQLDTVRLEVTGDAGSDYGYKISFDFVDGDFDEDLIPPGLNDLQERIFTSQFIPGGTTAGGASIKDAYATWKIGEAVSGKMGRFKPHFLRSSSGVSDNRLLFLQRTVIGEAFSGRDIGLQFSGNFDTIGWAISGTNGSDGAAEDFLFCGRLEASLMGAGASKVEGAYGAGEGTNLTAGIAALDDGDVEDGMALGIDMAVTAGPFSAAAEIADLDEDIGDATPWDITLGYMFTDMYEVAARYEDFDDDDGDTTRITAGVNRYVQGHDIKWQLQFITQDSDTDAFDADQFGLGLALSF